MNNHPVEAHRIGDHYTAHFYVIWKQDKPFTVCDDDGYPVRFPSWEKATIAAYQARDTAEEGRFTHWRGVPQIRDIPKLHEARSRAGKKAFAERKLREAMRQGAAE